MRSSLVTAILAANHHIAEESDCNDLPAPKKAKH
jgi:hypothetical protein